MKNMTKAELLNEIKALQAAVKANEQWRRENSSEIKQLRDGATADAFEIRDLRNQIKQLQADAVHDAKESDKKSNEIEGLRADKWRLYDLEDEYRSEIKRLEQTARARLDTISVMSKKISKLQKAYNEINGAFGSSLRSQLKKDNEIKLLREQAVVDAETDCEKSNEINELKDVVIALRNDYNDLNDRRWAAVKRSTEKSNEIKRLRQHIDDDEITIQNKQNEINNLRCDIDYRQTIITEMRNEINELEAKVADLEQMRNDSRRFHNATEALGNPKHFQEVT